MILDNKINDELHITTISELILNYNYELLKPPGGPPKPDPPLPKPPLPGGEPPRIWGGRYYTYYTQYCGCGS